MPHFVLEARFIAERYGGLEWPPAPMRLLQAIVAGCRNHDLAGLRWLETLGAPDILAEPDPPSSHVRTWVPNNTERGTPGTPNEKTSRDRNVRRIAHPVTYIWRIEDHDGAHAQEVLSLASNVHTLGTGQDMCAVNGFLIPALEPSSDDSRLWWRPSKLPEGWIAERGITLRVPIAGSLDSVRQRHEASLQRFRADAFVSPVLPPANHCAVKYLSSHEMPRMVGLPVRFAAMSGSTSPSWHMGDTVRVAGMLRHAAIQALGGSIWGAWASGHAPESDLDARLSWVPLPSIGHRNVDRRIRRAVFLARPSEQAGLIALQQALLQDRLRVTDEASGEIKATLCPVDSADQSTGVLSRYLAEGTVWQSVTPVALPGDFATDEKRVLKLIRKALREAQIDLGLVKAIVSSRVPLHAHDLPISAFKLKVWKAHAVPLRHVRIEFSRPVRGPIAIGRGRHFGLGLLCADRE